MPSLSSVLFARWYGGILKSFYMGCLSNYTGMLLSLETDLSALDVIIEWNSVLSESICPTENVRNIYPKTDSTYVIFFCHTTHCFQQAALLALQLVRYSSVAAAAEVLLNLKKKHVFRQVIFVFIGYCVGEAGICSAQWYTEKWNLIAFYFKNLYKMDCRTYYVSSEEVLRAQQPLPSQRRSLPVMGIIMALHTALWKALYSHHFRVYQWMLKCHPHRWLLMWTTARRVDRIVLLPGFLVLQPLHFSKLIFSFLST